MIINIVRFLLRRRNLSPGTVKCLLAKLERLNELSVQMTHFVERS